MGTKNKGGQPCWFTTLCVDDIVLNREQRPSVQISSGSRAVTITPTSTITTASFFPGTSFIHNDVTTVHVCAVHSFNSFVTTRVHLNECKSLGSSGLTVTDDLGRDHNRASSKWPLKCKKRWPTGAVRKKLRSSTSCSPHSRSVP